MHISKSLLQLQQENRHLKQELIFKIEECEMKKELIERLKYLVTVLKEKNKIPRTNTLKVV